MYNLSVGELPDVFLHMFRRNSVVHNYPTRQSMDLLQMDIHPRVNEFMHLSLSKVSQKHFRYYFPL